MHDKPSGGSDQPAQSMLVVAPSGPVVSPGSTTVNKNRLPGSSRASNVAFNLNDVAVSRMHEACVIVPVPVPEVEPSPSSSVAQPVPARTIATNQAALFMQRGYHARSSQVAPLSAPNAP